ncbi:MAG: diguanylate cyclase [Clostridiales bacterium]|jgi:diguanylate cyclase (GGDEF)-like protein|nr:diguanylate cyclase [Clostridiales bacterium]
MKEWFFKFAPLVLLVVGAGIWLAAFLFYEKISLNMVLTSVIIGQLIIFFYCGIIIQKLHQQANIDSLTGICNRRSFFTKMSEIVKMKFPVSLMMIDVDNFKRINDTHGHSSGDEVLKQLAEILKSNTRSTDIVARLGGEEFAVVLPQTSCENVLKMAERIKQAIEAKTFIFDFETEKLTISIGIATTKLPIYTDSFLKYADGALYKAKELKNTIVTYE